MFERKAKPSTRRCYLRDNSSWESRATLNPMREMEKESNCPAHETAWFGRPLSVTINLQKGIIFAGGCWNFDVKCCNLSCKQAGCQERLFDHETLSFLHQLQFRFGNL